VIQLTPNFTSNLRLANINQVINFQDTSISAPISPTSWLWSFGDSTTSTLQNPTHSYSRRGVYTVILTITVQNVTKRYRKYNYIRIR
jgi:PKD repeat protein